MSEGEKGEREGERKGEKQWGEGVEGSKLLQQMDCLCV